MKVLFINQFYRPDRAATGQLLADQAEELSCRGHEVHVLCSARAYGGGHEHYPARETLNGVHLHRVGATGFGRNTFVGRLADYLSFYLIALFRAFFLPRMDVCVCLTTPPFIGVVGALLRAVKGTQFVLWVMDIYPQIAVTFGVIKSGSLLDRALGLVSRILYRRAARIISLGEVMTQRLVEAGADPGRITTVHNWVPQESVEPKPRKESEVRRGWGLNGDLTVMYSGNLGLGHDLSTLVKAAARLHKDLDFRMLFVGEGKGKAPLERVCREQDAECVSFYPPQPLENLGDSLAAGDVHLVSQNMGTQGLIVPSKVYGILAAGRPTVFVGPEDCEPAQIIRASQSGVVIRPGDVEGAAQALYDLLLDGDLRKAMGRRARDFYETRFGRVRSVAANSEAIEEAGKRTEVRGLGTEALGRLLRPALLLMAPLALLASVLFWGRGSVGAVAVAPFRAMWENGLAKAFHTYSTSPTFWALLVGSFVVTACLTPLAMVVARRIGAVDRGGHRKVSQISMPLLGGIAVAVPFLVVCVLGIVGATQMLHPVFTSPTQVWAMLIGGLFILGVGIIDDTRGMRVRNKFFSQVSVAAFLCFCGYSIRTLNLPFVGNIDVGLLPGAALTILWIVGLTNAVNIIDGLDGLASGIALIAAIGLGFIAAINGAIFLPLLCATLAGSLAAFLLFNFHPARIFLGDTGSLFLGFVLAALSLTGSFKTSGTVIFLAPILALGVPLFEIVLSMLRRYLRGLPISSADASHIHHRLLKQGFSQRRVALILYAAGIVCMLAALLTTTLSSQKPSAMILPLSMYAAAMLLVGWLAGYSRDLGNSVEIRKRNVFYQSLVNYATMSLSNDVGVLGANSILEIARSDMRLSFLSASFLDPGQSIGISGVINQEENGMAPDPMQEIHLKSANGEHVFIQYQHAADPGKHEREEIRMHLGRMFEHATIKRVASKTESKPIRVGDRYAADGGRTSATRPPRWQAAFSGLETRGGAEISGK